MNRRITTVVIALACSLAALCLGLYFGGHPGKLPDPLRKAFVQDDRAVQAQLLDEVQDNFYKKVSRKQLDQASLKGVVDSLHDQFSHYLTPTEAKLFRQSLSHGFEGVGMTINGEKKGLRVVMVFKGSPAQRAGIKKDDLVVAVNGQSIAGVPSTVSTGKIKGPAGTEVRLSVLSAGASKPRVLTMKRERISVPIAIGRMVHHNGVPLAYVRLAAFDSGAHAAVAQELRPLLRKGAKGIIFDLRGNPGGLLEEGVLTASLFIEKGPIVSTSGRTQPRHVFGAAGGTIAPTIPMVVLVDKGSASASEIVTGALRDRGRATVVGQKTYGKGVFQNVISLQNGGILDLTVGSYFLPKGANLAHNGIEPSAPARDLPKTRRDEALPVAIDVLYAKVR